MLTHCFVAFRLLGILMLQTWFYYNWFPKDPVFTKLLVCDTNDQNPRPARVLKGHFHLYAWADWRDMVCYEDV